MMPSLTRRRFIALTVGSAAAAAGGLAYMRWGEPHWLEVTRRSVPLAPAPGIRSVLRVLHLSDFHASPVVADALIAKAVTLGLAQKPDLIALTGDFFTNQLDDAPALLASLRRLSATAPTFACLGNHDGGPWTRGAGGYATTDEALALLRAANITCLHNDARELTIRDRSLQLIGVGDLWSHMCDPVTAFSRAAARGERTRISLSHNPDAKELLRPHDWDLALCGHTHGGQLRLPFLGTPFAPVQDKRFVEGLHRWENRWLHITRGVGNLHGLRFNCRPEVSVLELT